MNVSAQVYILLCVFGSAAACAAFAFASTTSAMVVTWGANGFAQSGTNTLLVAFLADLVPLDLRGSIL